MEDFQLTKNTLKRFVLKNGYNYLQSGNRLQFSCVTDLFFLDWTKRRSRCKSKHRLQIGFIKYGLLLPLKV